MIVAAALPLVAEYGPAVTTSRIARAAGIGEGTIFRVFKDKEDVLDACVNEALSPDHVLRELASVPREQPLSVRLLEAAEALRAHLDRLGSVLGALHARGRQRGDAPPDERSAPRGRPLPGAAGESGRPASREESTAAVRDGVAELIEPDRHTLRLAPDKIASVFVGMLSTRALPPADLVDVLLHGTLHSTLTAPSTPARERNDST
ncbi:Transcriptional regulator, TetR family [Streptomyces sp. S4.7]|nr:TetR/AcrR family transcriptional regulator [Streptomyces sp. S4.7]QHY97431.1 Transcriptional regulator, TetR family [Streptomyces sp. S4.7]